MIKMIAIGSDHGGYKLKEEIKKYLEEKEIEYTDCGTFDEQSVDYPEIATAVSSEVQSGQAERGVIICRSGIGMSIVANKFKGIRCAKCMVQAYSDIHTEFQAKRLMVHQKPLQPSVMTTNLSMTTEVVRVYHHLKWMDMAFIS